MSTPTPDELEGSLEQIRFAWRNIHRELAATRRALAEAREEMEMLAHEVNNPLGTILLNAQLLAADGLGTETVETIIEAARRCKAMIEGRGRSTAERVDLSDI